MAQINGCGFAATFNLGEATSNGFDLSLEAAATSGVSMGATVSYVKATYDKTIGAGNTLIVSKGDWVGGNGIADGALPTPWTVSAHGRFGFPLFSSNGGYLWLEDVYHSHNSGPVASHQPGALSYDPALPTNPTTNVVNARLGVQIRTLDLSLFANNMFNSHPVLSEFHALSQNNGVLDNRLSAVTWRPLTVGVTLRLEF